MMGIYRASGMDKEVLDQMEATFRAEMEQREKPGTRAESGNGAGDPDSAEQESLDAEADVDADGHTDSTGD